MFSEVEKFLDKKGMVCSRGSKREPVCERGGHPYFTIGKHPHRGGGVKEKDLSAFSGSHKIRKHMNMVERVATGYIDTNEINAIKKVLKEAVSEDAAEKADTKEETIFPSLAGGRNVFLPHHTDKDFFYSITSVLWGSKVEINDPVIKYFTFAECGIAVGLRPGDIIIFNAQSYHSISSATKAALKKDLFCLTLYLKTAAVAGNTNQRK